MIGGGSGPKVPQQEAVGQHRWAELFIRSIQSILGWHKGAPAVNNQADVGTLIRPVVVVGTSESGEISTTSTLTGRTFRFDSAFRLITAAFSTPLTQTAYSGAYGNGAMRVGDVRPWRVETLGADSSLFSAYPSSEDHLLEVLAIIASADMAAVVATRTLTVDITIGLNSLAVPTPDWRSSAVTLTNNQNGGIFVFPGGVLLNDDGTITLDTVPSPVPFPLMVGANLGAGTMVANITTADANDTTSITAIVRRVA